MPWRKEEGTGGLKGEKERKMEVWNEEGFARGWGSKIGNGLGFETEG